MKSTKTIKAKPLRVRLTKEKRERLIQAYVERFLASNGNLPSQRQISQTVGGNIYSILAVLKEYRGDGIEKKALRLRFSEVVKK